LDLKAKGVIKYRGIWHQPGEIIKNIDPIEGKRLLDAGIAEYSEEVVEQQYQEAKQKTSKVKGNKKADEGG